MTGLVVLVVGAFVIWVINRPDGAPPLPYREALSRACRAVATRRDTSRQRTDRGGHGGGHAAAEVAPGVYVDRPDRSTWTAVTGRADRAATDLDRWVADRIDRGQDRTETAKAAARRHRVSLRTAQRAVARVQGGDRS
jgi:hypothetical protein